MKTQDASPEIIREKLKRTQLLQKLRETRSENRKQKIDLRLTQMLVANLQNENLKLRENFNRLRFEIDHEMEMAKNIQDLLMPKSIPQNANVQLSAQYIPSGKVGGDLYDIIITPKQKVAMLIFDVSGHGVAAAMIGAMAKILFVQQIEKSESPSEIFRYVNKHICDYLKTEQYLTAFLGIFDPLRNTLTYSRAGHVPPLLFQSESQKIRRFESKGLCIGHSALVEYVNYKDEVCKLAPRDKLLLYTDGLSEGINPRNELYGIERLEICLLQNGQLSPDKLLAKVVDDQNKFREGVPLRDDFTIVCIEFGDPDALLHDSGFSANDEPKIISANSYLDIDRVLDCLMAELKECEYDDSTLKQFKICIFELMSNALVHGNKSDASKKVLIVYKITSQDAMVSVVDEGQGFDFRKTPELLDTNFSKTKRGRGLFLVKYYMDEVKFNDKGNRVQIRKVRMPKGEQVLAK